MRRTCHVALLFGVLLACVATFAAGARTSKDCTDCDPVFGGIPMLRTEHGAMTTEGFVALESRTFVVGYSDARMDPLWVCYRVYAVSQVGSPARRGWRIDNRTVSRVSDTDFKHTEGSYERGHIAPKSALYHCYGQAAVNDSFVLSNACPQLGDFNDGPWGDLEDLVRNEYSVRFEEVWIIAGPIFDDSNGREYLTKEADYSAWAQKPVEIPDAFYKIIIDIEAGSPRVLAFIIDHDEGYDYGEGEIGKHRLGGSLVSVDEIERQTGLDFLWTLEDTLEEDLEDDEPVQMW